MGFYWLVVAICAFEIAVAARALNRRLIRFLVFFALGVVHGLVPLLGPNYHIGTSWTPSPDALANAPHIVFLGVAAMAAMWHIGDLRKSRVNLRPAPHPLVEQIRPARAQRAAWHIAVLTGVLGVVAALAIFYLSAGSISAYTDASRFQYRSSGGIPAALALQLLVCGFVPGFIGPQLRVRRQRLTCFAYAAGFAGWYYFATRGTRSIPIGILGAVFIGYLYTRVPTRKTALLTTAAVVLAAFAAVGLYQVRRDLGHLSVLQAADNLTKVDTYRNAVNTDPLNYNGEFLAAVDNFPSRHAYLNGASYWRITLAPVPGRIVPGLKPQDTHITFGETIVGPGTRVSIPPSIPGDAYINFGGVVGVVVMMGIWGWLGARLDRRLARSARLAFWLGPELVRLLILGVRGQPYEVAVIAVVSWLVVRAASRVCNLNMAETTSRGTPVHQGV